MLSTIPEPWGHAPRCQVQLVVLTITLFSLHFHISTSFIIFDVHVECDVKQAGKISCVTSQVPSFTILEIWLMRPVDLREGEVGRKRRAS